MSLARAAGLVIAIAGLTSCATQRRTRDLTTGEIDRYAAVCYAAPPAVLLQAVEDVLRGQALEITHVSVPAGWLTARQGDWGVVVRLRTLATCSRIDITGWVANDPYESVYVDGNYLTRNQLYPLIRRRLARIADVPGHPLPGDGP